MTTASTRNLIVNVSLANIKDQVAALLYATSFIGKNETILDLKFGSDIMTSTDEIIAVEVTIKKEVEVTKYITHG